jgi:hypothetical protein
MNRRFIPFRRIFRSFFFYFLTEGKTFPWDIPRAHFLPPLSIYIYTRALLGSSVWRNCTLSRMQFHSSKEKMK